jgi:protein-S-isoprenylcysteine O-methyltransferase Ste14
MTAAHLVFAIATTAYIFVAIQFEEQDLIRFYGDAYRHYREQVPMIFPFRLSHKPREVAAKGQRASTSSGSL